jgi:hypothetical protein
MLKTRNRSYPLNPQRFPKAFELNEDYEESMSISMNHFQKWQNSLNKL